MKHKKQPRNTVSLPYYSIMLLMHFVSCAGCAAMLTGVSARECIRQQRCMAAPPSGGAVAV